MKHIFPVILAVQLFAAASTLLFAETSYAEQPLATSHEDIKRALVSEFAGSYPVSAPQSQGIYKVAITAEASAIELFPGKVMQVWSYNGQIPGPEIRLQYGETLQIAFLNNLPQPTSIHFHGIRVPNAMDGVPGVTQDAVQPGETFVYEFTPKDAGTYWYHPHVRTSEQLEKGLYGVIVVEDGYSDRYQQDKVWVIDDWRIGQDYQIDPRFVTPHDLMHDGRWGNVLTVNGKLEERLQVRPGERIRLRLVNTSNARVYRLDFSGLHAKGIAVDGILTGRPIDAQNFVLAPGNRIDADITIPQDAADATSYTIRDTITGDSNPLGELVVAGEPRNTPDFAYPTNRNIPDWSNAVGLQADSEYRLNARRKEGGGMMGIEWTINEQAYPAVTTIALQHGEFNTLRFVNESSRLHPMHLHGQFFKVITRDGKRVDEPWFRDTVLISGGEAVTVGMVPLDRGEWLNHCHITEHADSGMMTLLQIQ